MSESTRRRKYRYDRVLIETERILDPQFSDAVLYLTGAQIEMLRNVTQYLIRLDTYVTEYASGYYLAPTAEDYDAILAIVADLEESLMGNPNTIWGYKDRLLEAQSHQCTSTGDYTLSAFTVPAGYVYEVNVANSRDIESIVTQKHFITDGATFFQVAQFDNQPAEIFCYATNMHYRLKEGDRYDVQFIDAQDNDRVYVRVWGYKMVVP